MKISKAPQGSDEWFQIRLGKLTASRAGDLMLRTKAGKPYATRKNYITELALQRITGQIPEQKDSQAMEYGREMEATARLAYEFKTGKTVEETGFWYEGNIGASPDGITETSGVEIKNPLPATHAQTLKEHKIPEYYYWQVLQNLLVTGKDSWDYVSHRADFPPNASLYIETVHRSEVEKDLTKLAEELQKANQEIEKEVEFIKNYK